MHSWATASCVDQISSALLYPAWLGKDLAELPLGSCDHAARVVKQDGPRGSRALIECKYVTHGVRA